MDKLYLAVALIRTVDDEGIRWLAEKDPESQCLRFVIAERLEQESLREALAREVSWRWDLDRRRDFIVSCMAQLNVELIENLPGRSDKAHLLVSFCSCDIYREATLAKIASDPRSVWLDSETIWAGETEDGFKIDPVFHLLNRRFRVIEAWDSTKMDWTSDPPPPQP